MRASARYLGCAAILLLAASCSDNNERDRCDCSDGLFCNGVEFCNEDGSCSPGVPPTVDDGIDCTVDVCDEEANIVRNTPDNSACDDGLFCTGVETCSRVAGCVAGTPPGDGIPCTDDFCDEDNDVVVGTPNDANCDDGLFCNGNETCAAPPGGGFVTCLAGTPPIVNDDGVGCTDDFCDEAIDQVVNRPNDSNCDDTLFCNGAEFCDAVLDCRNGPIPSDGVACTDDICDEVNDIMTPVPNNNYCNDQQFCNGTETCDPILDCQNGAPPVLDDGIVCTDDICDEANDEVVNIPNDLYCDNFLFCDGQETCSPVMDCVDGTPPMVVDDGIDCTNDYCNEDIDQVVNEPDDTFCADADPCTADICDTAIGCDSAPDLTCGTCDNCSFETGDFTGWDAQDMVDPFFPLGVYTFGGGDSGFFGGARPSRGQYAAVNGWDGDGPGTIEFGQDITISAAPAATLTFDYFVGWDLTFGGSIDRTFEVTVEPPGGGVPMQTTVIETAQQGTFDYDTIDKVGFVDLTPFVGQTVHIRFIFDVPESFVGPGMAQVDNVQVM